MNTELAHQIDIIIDGAESLLSEQYGVLTDRQRGFIKIILANAEKFIHVATAFSTLPLSQVSRDLRHELGNPLTPMYGYSELLKIGMIDNLTEGQQEQILRIVEATIALRIAVDAMVADARKAAQTH